MDSTTQHTSLNLSDAAADFLTTTRKWAFFIAIMGFVWAGFMMLAGLAIGLLGSAFIPQTEDTSPVVGLLLGLFYALCGLLYFFPSYFLLRFSTITKDAITLRLGDRLTEAFRYLKSYFAFMGVVLLVAIGLFIVGIMVVILMTLVAASNGNY